MDAVRNGRTRIKGDELYGGGCGEVEDHMKMLWEYWKRRMSEGEGKVREINLRML